MRTSSTILKYIVTGLYVGACLAASIVFMTIVDERVPTPHNAAAGIWKAATDGVTVNFYCSSDGAYRGHVKRDEGGWYNTFVGPNSQGSFIDQESAERYIQKISAEKCE